MTVTKERLTEILEKERDLGLEAWERFFDSMTEEEQAAYIEADSGQER